MDKRAKAPVESMVIQDDISHQGTTLVVHAANSSLQEVALTKSKGQERICGSFTDELRITNERMFPSKCSAPTLGEHVPDVDQDGFVLFDLAAVTGVHHASFPSIGKSLYPSPSGQVVEDTSHRQFAYLN